MLFQGRFILESQQLVRLLSPIKYEAGTPSDTVEPLGRYGKRP